MDCSKTLNFLKEITRLCRNFEGYCEDCPLGVGADDLYGVPLCQTLNLDDDDFKELVKKVQDYSDSHPIKTRQSEFLKQFPNATTDNEGDINLCPRYIDTSVVCPAGYPCSSCKKRFWLKEI